MKKIGIVVAMTRESGLLNLFTNHKLENICGLNFYLFKANENEIILSTCGIGEISASSATSILICHYKVEEIINYGFVGSLKADLPVNVVVGVTSVVHTDMDLRAFGNALGQYDEMKDTYFYPNESLTKSILGENVYMGRLASADKFIADGNVKMNIAKEFGASICDMEGAGISVTCTRSKIPFALVKVVADGIEEDCTQTFFNNSTFGVDGAVEKIAEYIQK